MAKEARPALQQLEALLEVFPGQIFYQPVGRDAGLARREAVAAIALDPARVVAKLPATKEFFGIAASLAAEERTVAVTGVYAPAQAVVACAAGAQWIIPYVNRAKRLLPAGGQLVSELAEVLRAVRAPTRILAASVKAPTEAVEALLAGAAAIAVPLVVIEQMAEHPLTRDAVAEFAVAYSALESTKDSTDV